MTVGRQLHCGAVTQFTLPPRLASTPRSLRARHLGLPLLRCRLTAAACPAAHRQTRSRRQRSVRCAAIVSPPTELQLAPETLTTDAAEVGLAKTAATGTPVLSGAGGGIFFFWQLGVVKYLQQKYDLSRVNMVGASAGALLVTLAACDVDAEVAVEAAHQLALKNGLFERPLGFAGVWGGLIRDWLEELLPDDAVERCRGRVKVVATGFPSLRLAYLDDFTTRAELIDACMASVHIPFLLDWQLCTRYRSKLYLDGSVHDFLTWSNSDLVTVDKTACVLDYSQDELLTFGRLDFVKLRNLEEVLALMQQGMDYARRSDEAGVFDKYFQGLERPWFNAATGKLQQLSRTVLNNILPWAGSSA